MIRFQGSANNYPHLSRKTKSMIILRLGNQVKVIENDDKEYEFQDINLSE